ncbi:minor capsid protein [Capybara microvirus Cap3_SP_394]|nr:minor capsid protein [Capybara microvirus Cap3_SP_394]
MSLSVAAGTALAGLASAVGSLGAGYLSSQGQAMANKKGVELAHEQMRWQERMRDEQNDWTLAQWNRENEYNSASNYVKRLREAGLNPLYYDLNGNGSAAGIQSASTGSASMPQIRNEYEGMAQGMAQSMPQILGAMQQLANIEQTKAQTQQTRQQTTGLTIDNAIKSLTQDSQISKIRQEAVNALLTGKSIETNTQLTAEQVGNVSALTREIEQRITKLGIESAKIKQDTTIAALMAVLGGKETLAKIDQIKAQTHGQHLENQVREATKYLAMTFGVDPQASDVYNIASLLLNPKSRHNVMTVVNDLIGSGDDGDDAGSSGLTSITDALGLTGPPLVDLPGIIRDWIDSFRNPSNHSVHAWRE